jgi:hypothetical protein
MYADSGSGNHARAVSQMICALLACVMGAIEWSVRANHSPQSTMAVAQVVFHRFYFVSSMHSFGVMVSPDCSALTISRTYEGWPGETRAADKREVLVAGLLSCS